MRTSFAEASLRNEGACDLSHATDASWSSRLPSFAFLCEERAAEADERSSIHPDIAAVFHTVVF